ncbi:MAG: C26 family cysteine hydrolase domain-containing family [Candidatus Cloacimonetes bacterium]|nr:C26 family cysteine hydrolase domain-containing family [Candidatus Cloacimonadota bacterium]
MSKLLILNCTLAEAGIARLDGLFSEILGKLNIDFESIHLSKAIGNIDRFSHLLITGSALFASQANECDEKIYEIVGTFMNKHILGICYGHQMLAKALMKKNVCRQSKTPELGWRKIELNDNALFEGIQNPVLYESHFEEVFDLDDNFRIIAKNQNCNIQSFQYKDLPIWGVQFHPEITFEYGKQSIKNSKQRFAEKGDFFKIELENKSQIEQNFKIFKNFFKGENDEKRSL